MIFLLKVLIFISFLIGFGNGFFSNWDIMHWFLLILFYIFFFAFEFSLFVVSLVLAESERNICWMWVFFETRF